MKVWRLIQSLSTPNVVEDAGEVVITGRRRIWDSFLKVRSLLDYELERTKSCALVEIIIDFL